MATRYTFEKLMRDCAATNETLSKAGVSIQFQIGGAYGLTELWKIAARDGEDPRSNSRVASRVETGTPRECWLLMGRMASTELAKIAEQKEAEKKAPQKQKVENMYTYQALVNDTRKANERCKELGFGNRFSVSINRKQSELHTCFFMPYPDNSTATEQNRIETGTALECYQTLMERMSILEEHHKEMRQGERPPEPGMTVKSDPTPADEIDPDYAPKMMLYYVCSGCLHIWDDAHECEVDGECPKCNNLMSPFTDEEERLAFANQAQAKIKAEVVARMQIPAPRPPLQPNGITVTIEGGCVQGVYADGHAIDYRVIDSDHVDRETASHTREDGVFVVIESFGADNSLLPMYRWYVPQEGDQ